MEFRMKEINVNEMKKIQLEILQCVARYCDENDLQYFLAYGTLIGAIRHKGFIPWDDDIDIAMTRPDYEKFISGFNGTIQNISVYSTELDHNFPYSYAKVSNDNTVLIENSGLKCQIGVNIDLFPIDGIPLDDKLTIKKQMFYRNLLDIKTVKVNSERNLLKNTILILGKIALFWSSVKGINLKMIETAKKYSFENEEYCCAIAFGSSADKVLPKEYFKETIQTLFEGHVFTTAKYYHEWLTGIYGDYMQLPPEEEQTSHHDFKAYLK